MAGYSLSFASYYVEYNFASLTMAIDEKTIFKFSFSLNAICFGNIFSIVSLRLCLFPVSFHMWSSFLPSVFQPIVFPQNK